MFFLHVLDNVSLCASRVDFTASTCCPTLAVDPVQGTGVSSVPPFKIHTQALTRDCEKTPSTPLKTGCPPAREQTHVGRQSPAASPFQPSHVPISREDPAIWLKPPNLNLLVLLTAACWLLFCPQTPRPDQDRVCGPGSTKTMVVSKKDHGTTCHMVVGLPERIT